MDTGGKRKKGHKSIHTGEKPRACDVCEKEFTFAENMKRHMLIHTGDKQHACGACLKQFTDA